MKVRICPKCGKHNPENSWSCEDCGETLPMNVLVSAEDERSVKELTNASRIQEEKVAKKKKSIEEKEAAKRQLQELQQKLMDEQDFKGGWLAGSAIALICAIVWALITFFANRQIGWMAIGVGYLVGSAISWKGKGSEAKFGVAGVILSFLSCLAGNILASALFYSQQNGVPLLDVLFFLLISPMVILELMIHFFSPIDIVFYGFAIATGYKFSFRNLTKQEKFYMTKAKSM